MKTARRSQGSRAVADAAPKDSAAEQRRFEFERRLPEAERVMMQILQTSLSLIGFGFTINAFFQDATSLLNADVIARRVGLALLSLGLVFLATGIRAQAVYRRRLVLQYQPAHRWGQLGAVLETTATPAFVTALMLLIVGLVALGSILIREFA